MDGKRIYELMQKGGILHQSFDLLDPEFSKDLLGPSSGPSCEEIKQVGGVDVIGGSMLYGLTSCGPALL